MDFVEGGRGRFPRLCNCPDLMDRVRLTEWVLKEREKIEILTRLSHPKQFLPDSPPPAAIPPPLAIPRGWHMEHASGL